MGPKDADVELGAFLDFMCPFSRKAYRTLRNEVFPHYMRKEQAVKPSGRSLSFSFYQHVQPWHPQGILLHNAAMAVGTLGGDDDFFVFSDELFKHVEEVRLLGRRRVPA